MSETIEVTGLESLALGTVDAARVVTASFRASGKGEISVEVSLRGAHAAAITLVHKGATHSGPGPHRFTSRNNVRVAVVIDVPLDEGSLDATLALSWTGGGVDAAVSGTIRVFSVAAGADLGDVPLGQSAAAGVTVQNHAREPIEVTVTPPSSPFSATVSGPVTIPTGASSTIPIELAPTAVGPVTGTLRVAYGAIVKTATLRGVGVDPADRFDDAADVDEPDGSPTYTSGASAGQFQRLYLHVPTKNTNVSLGKEYDRSQHDPTHAGYSATTEGHVLIRNRTAERTMTFQAADQVWIQSTTSNVYLGAGDGGMAFIAGSGVYLTSGKGVVLAAGHGDIGTMNEFASGTAPPVPAVNAIGDAMNQVGLGWMIANTLMGGVGMYYAATRVSLAARNIYKTKKWSNKYNAFLLVPFAGFVSTATMTGASIHDTINKNHALGRDPVLPSQSINMFAEGGFLAGTWGFCSIYGAVGATFRSVNAGVLGLVTASLDSLVATGAFGTRSAGLQALKGVSIDGGLQNQIATPNGTLDIKGLGITMGASAGHLVQGTAGVSVAAPTVEAKAGTALAAQGAQVNAAAATKITIAVAGAYGVEITPDGVKVGNLLAGAIDAARPSLAIGADGVTISGGPAPVHLKLSPTGVVVKAPGNDVRHMGATFLSRAVRVELG